MGVVIIATILTTYAVTQDYADPDIVIIIVTLLTAFLLVITQILVNAFEKIVSIRKLEALRTKELFDLKDQFVYIAVHDLSASATAVKWGLRTIEPVIYNTLSPIEKEVFGSIRTRNEELIALVRQILMITRLERNDIKLNITDIALSEFMKPLLKDARKESEKRHIDVEAEIPEDMPFIRTDTARLAEIVAILLSNSMKYADDQNGKVRFSITQNGKDSRNITITVENNGAGIPSSEQEHIFEKIWRAKHSSKIERTGFGLHIARTLARLLGGDITFISVPGKTVFTLTLPRTPQPAT